MNKVLVTGATGMLGFNIVKGLQARGREVRALVRSIPKGQKLLGDTCEFVQGDLEDLDSIRTAMKGCKVVYHAAGLPEQWQKDEDIFRRVNTEGTKNIVKVALEEDVQRFIYSSTIDVFEGHRGKEYDESTIDAQPKGTAYERSKQEADRVVVEAMEKGLPAIFLHPSAIYGPGPSGRNGPNGLFVRLANGEIPMLLPGGFPVVYSEDVAEGHILAEEKAEVGSRYILSESYWSLTQLVQQAVFALKLRKCPPTMPLWVAKLVAWAGMLFSRITNKPPLIASGELHFLQWQAIPSSAKAQKELDWRPKAFEEGLQETIRFLELGPKS